jgi:hypothetical protein
MQKELKGEGLSVDGFKLLAKRITDGDVLTQENRNAKAEMFERISDDKFAGQSRDQVYTAALSAGCNFKQAEEAAKFFADGGLNGVTIHHEGLIQREIHRYVQGLDEKQFKKDKWAWYEAVRLQLPRDREITKADVEFACSKVAADPGYMKAVKDKSDGGKAELEYRSPMTTEEYDYIAAILRKERGIEPGDDEIKLYFRNTVRGLRGGKPIETSPSGWRGRIGLFSYDDYPEEVN